MLKINRLLISLSLLTSYVLAEDLMINGARCGGAVTYEVNEGCDNISFKIEDNNINVGTLPQPSLSDQVVQIYNNLDVQRDKMGKMCAEKAIDITARTQNHGGALLSGKTGIFLKSTEGITMNSVFAETTDGQIRLTTPKFNASNLFMKTSQKVLLTFDGETGHPLKGLSWEGGEVSPHAFNYFINGELSFTEFSTNNDFFIIFGARKIVFNPDS